MTDQQLDFMGDFDISAVEQSSFSLHRHTVQKSGLIAKMGPTSFTVYCVLRSFVNPSTGVAWPGNDTIGEIIDRKHDTVGRSVDELTRLKLIYQDSPPGGSRTRGIRLIDWLPAHVMNDAGNLVRGKIAVPCVPSKQAALVPAAIAAAASQSPMLALRNHSVFSSYHYMRLPIDGEWVFLLTTGNEKLSRPFFTAAGVPFDDVVAFYASERALDKDDQAKRLAATVAAQEFYDGDGF